TTADARIGRDCNGEAGLLHPHSGTGELGDLLQDPVFLEAAQVIDEERAVQMIDLMTHRAGHEAFAPHLARLSVTVEVTQLHALGPRHDLHEIRDRKASL